MLAADLKASTCHDFGNAGGRPGAYPPRVQRTNSATGVSNFDNIGGWMVLAESSHCPFDVIEACRTGVRRDLHQPGWRSSRPTTWPSPIKSRFTLLGGKKHMQRQWARLARRGWCAGVVPTAPWSLERIRREMRQAEPRAGRSSESFSGLISGVRVLSPALSGGRPGFRAGNPISVDQRPKPRKEGQTESSRVAGRGAVSIGPSALRVAGLLARMGQQRLEEAVPGVVQDGEWSLLPDLRWRPGRMEDRAPEWRVEFKRSPDAKARAPSQCRRLAGRRFNPQQGGGVEAGAVGQIRDRRKVSTSVTGTRASTAARAPRRGRRVGLCGREGIPHAPANGSAWARGQRGRGQHGGRGLTGDGSNEPGEVARHYPETFTRSGERTRERGRGRGGGGAESICGGSVEMCWPVGVCFQ